MKGSKHGKQERHRPPARALTQEMAPREAPPTSFPQGVPTRGTGIPFTPVTGPSAALSAWLTARAPDGLTPAALRVYQALHVVALEVAAARGYAPGTTQVTYHAPAEVLARVAGVSRGHLYRVLADLRTEGLVASRGHYTTLRGRTVQDGTIWTVKLVPGRGKAARVRYEDLAHKWRDLAHDIRVGRTAYLQMRQSDPRGQRPDSAELLLDWALPPRRHGAPLPLTVASGPEALSSLFDLPVVPRSSRADAVNRAAGALIGALQDPGRADLYRWLLWQALRVHDQTGRDLFPTLYDAARRAAADKAEHWARRAGAVLVARLKRSGVWDELATAPPWRVAA